MHLNFPKCRTVRVPYLANLILFVAMNRVENIVRTARPSAAVHLRDQGYYAGDESEFLSDVLGLANAECKGGRLIAMGVVTNPDDKRRFTSAHPSNLERPDYARLVSHYIEPALKVTYRDLNVDGATIGLLHIQPGDDLPYLMRMDHCMNLRRGDGFTRVGGKTVRMGRSDLERVFLRKLNGAERTSSKAPVRPIEIGFVGNPLVGERLFSTVDLSQRPSELARGKIGQFMHTLESASGTGSTSVVQRLNHARIFGTEKPYEKRSRQQLMGDFADIGDQMWEEDQKYLFETHGHTLDVAALNTLEESLLNFEFSALIPRVDGLQVAGLDNLALDLADDQTRITSNSKHFRISTAIDKLKAGTPIRIFKDSVRFCAGTELAGKRIPLEYELSASNLKAPVMGRLQLAF